MKTIQPNQSQPVGSDLEQPAAELIEKLKAINNAVYIPVGFRSFNEQECEAIREFACQMPISQGFNPATLHLLHRLVFSQHVIGQSTTVDWQMMAGRWKEICERSNSSHLVNGLPLLLQWCFEPGNTRVIGLMEMEWDADNRTVTISVNQPNYKRMVEWLETTFNAVQTIETPLPASSSA